jgi:hypothetical protein
MKDFVLTDYGKLPDDKIAPFSQGVRTSLTGNKHFNITPEMATHFDEVIDDYLSKLSNAKIGTSQDVAAKNVAKEVLRNVLQDVAKVVNEQADGDVEKLQSSGFTLAKERAKKGVLPKPSNFKVKSGSNSGDLLCVVDACTNARIYNFYSAAIPSPVSLIDWRLTPSTTRKKNISGFVPGKQYELKCAYLGTEETLVFSDSITIFVQ